MNRYRWILTVWIDDSAEQDRAVLEHLKRTEANLPSGQADPDVLAARALWSVVKQHRISVRIPFARRIQFSNAANRRNPAMLFDLIKCHAALRFLQREPREVNSVIAIEATRQDFDAAARLYGAITREGGGQESKMTRNEAAALQTIARMGWETFTVRMLQQVTELSYHRTRRISAGAWSAIRGRRPTAPARHGRVSARDVMHGSYGRGTRRRGCGDTYIIEKLPMEM